MSEWSKGLLLFFSMMLLPMMAFFYLVEISPWDIEWLRPVIMLIQVFIIQQVFALRSEKDFQKYSIYRYEHKDRLAIIIPHAILTGLIGWISYNEFRLYGIYWLLIPILVLAIFFGIQYELASPALRNDIVKGIRPKFLQKMFREQILE